MSGSLRFFLASLVVVSHLVGSDNISHLGLYAVRTFFILSGFAMTAALNDIYRFDGPRYLRNRVLRLAPGYIAICLITAITISLDPEDASNFQPRWAATANPVNIIENLAIIPLTTAAPVFRFFEPAWSIAVEILMYLLLYLGIARSKKAAITTLCLGVGYHAILILDGDSFSMRYFSAASALLEFSLGALVYFYKSSGIFKTGRPYSVAACFLWLLNLSIAKDFMPESYALGIGYYFNTMLSVIIVANTPTLAPGQAGYAIDRFLGELSYPLFLSQWIGGFFAAIDLPKTEWRGWHLLFTSAPYVLAIAILLCWIQEMLVDPERRRIRQTAARQIEIKPSGELAH